MLKPGGCLFSSFILMFGGVIYGLREIRKPFREREQELMIWPQREASL